MRAPTRQELFEEAMATVSTETRTLYCVVCEEFDRVERCWKSEFRYNHAENEGEARLTYAQNAAMRTPYFRIVACAPVVGYHVDDNQGLKLHV